MEYAAPLPSERIFVKTTNSPFIETDLEKVIKDLHAQRLVVAGLMTAHCVATTLRMAANLRVVDHSYGCPIKNQTHGSDAEIVLLEDATATFNVGHRGKNYDAETVHAVHLATMKDEFCDVGTTDEVIRSLHEV
ncbi:hypothetical protein CDD83_3734 [Cordyceps sp. RAO-2017]|nr:hypothetical protein CDD83_3734 [Cordyceps sp. RAO-2017]